MYLAATTALDRVARDPIAVGSNASWTTAWTPLNPFLTLESVLLTNHYRPQELAQNEAGALWRLWFGDPLRAQTYLSLVVSLALILYATMRVRFIGSRMEVANSWVSRLSRRLNPKNSVFLGMFGEIQSRGAKRPCACPRPCLACCGGDFLCVDALWSRSFWACIAAAP